MKAQILVGIDADGRCVLPEGLRIGGVRLPDPMEADFGLPPPDSEPMRVHLEYSPYSTYETRAGMVHHEARVKITFDVDYRSTERFYVFRNALVRVVGDGPEEETALVVKHSVLRSERAMVRIQREVAALENLEKLPNARREHIPDSVRLFVWQRDEGKCVRCGSNERLEFDHIIPVVEGGSSTERNIQLLCERCNREKGRSIG